MHAGTKHGFIPEAALIFSSKTKNFDYHGEMNESTFLQWFEEQLLKKLEEPSIIVLDNASYHSTLAEKTPNNSWRKEEIQNWLHARNVAFENNDLKLQLLHLVSQCVLIFIYTHKLNVNFRNKPQKKYEFQYGHEVLRLPPYHCIFNPIELIWGLTKTYYNKHIGRDGYGTIKALEMWDEALNTITPEIWANSVRHTENKIKQWWEREILFDQNDIEPIIINLDDNSDSEDDLNLISSDSD